MENWSHSSLKSALRKSELIQEDFYSRNSLVVAKELLGKVLAVKAAGRWVAGRIIETEAYRKDDPACHAFRKRTPRNEIMFGKPGRVYVYFIYGMYEMLNLVTEPEGEPGAVLIRALEPLEGIKTMQARRPRARKTRELTNGPGRLATSMGVKMSHKGDLAFGPRYLVLDDGFRVESISCSPRVGIKQGADLEWRYFITNHECVSVAPQNKQQRVLIQRALRR